MLRDNPPLQSQPESESESDSLHHAGDVGFKTVFQNEEAALEYLKEFCPEFVDHLDLGVFHLDTTSYVNQQFDEFFSDVVYRTQLKETSISATSPKKAAKKKKHPVAIVLLFEHKKHIRSYFLLFLQLLEYIIFIWRQDLANKKKPSLVIPIVVFQGKNGLKIRQFRDCFKGLPEELYKYFPNFEFHLTNVHPLSSERILNLNQKGLLRSLFLAYNFIEDRDRIKDVIFEIFSFFKYLPERLDFFKQMLVFISKEGYLSADELTELLEKYLSPEQKEGVVMTTYQEWRQKGLAEGEMNRARKIVLRGIGNGLSIVVLVDTSDLSYPIVEDLMKGYDSVYEFWQTETNNRDVVPQNDHLSEQEVRYLLDWLDKKRQ